MKQKHSLKYQYVNSRGGFKNQKTFALQSWYEFCIGAKNKTGWMESNRMECFCCDGWKLEPINRAFTCHKSCYLSITVLLFLPVSDTVKSVLLFRILWYVRMKLEAEKEELCYPYTKTHSVLLHVTLIPVLRTLFVSSGIY